MRKFLLAALLLSVSASAEVRNFTLFNGQYMFGFNAGSVLFTNGTALTQNNAELFWDNTNFRLGIGTATPSTDFQINKSVNGTVNNTIINANTGTSNNISFSLTNDSGATSNLTLFGNAFSATYLQNVARLSGSKAVWISSDVNSASGGTDPIEFSVGGYNNITAGATTNGLTAVNLTDTGISASGAGAPLSINSSQVVVSGVTSTFTTVSSASLTTTASTVATTTPAAGTYNVWFNGNITAVSNGGAKITAQITVGGTSQGTPCSGTATPFTSAALGVLQPQSFGAICQVTTTGNAIAVTGVTSAGTATITGAGLLISRVN